MLSCSKINKVLLEHSDLITLQMITLIGGTVKVLVFNRPPMSPIYTVISLQSAESDMFCSAAALYV